MEAKKVIENANNVLKGVSGSLRSADKEYRSISGVLKDIQRSNLLAAGYKDAFAAVGIDIEAGKLTPAEFFGKVHSALKSIDKKGNEYVGVWGLKTEEDGKKKPVLRKITSWTPRKVFMVLAQSIEAAK